MPELRRIRKVYHLRQRSNIQNSNNNNKIHSEKEDVGETNIHQLNKELIHKNRLIHVQSINPTTLLRLPAELILQVAHFLASPSFTIQQWDQPNIDLLNFSSTCNSIRSITRPLLHNQIIISIHHSNPSHSLSRAINRLQELSDPSHHSRHSSIKKLLIKDDGPDPNNSHRTRQSWYTLLSHALRHRLNSVQFFCYSKNLESVTESSPYQLLNIDPGLIHSVSTLKHLHTLYLSGLSLPQRSTRRNSINFGQFHNLNTLHLIAVHDSILNMIPHCNNLKELRIWRDFLIPFPSIHHWIDLPQWSTLENLKIKGFYGNSVILLQNSLIETRKSIDTTDLKMNLNTLDLDEPYSSNDALKLLEAFKSSHLLCLRLTVWRDEDFNPTLFEKISDCFPNLEDFQIVLETPSRRWWPHKINSWAQSLSKMQKLKRFTWNCSPFTCHDLIHIQAGMKSQAMILAKIIPTLERVAYADISGWLEIRRKPCTWTNRNYENQRTVIPCSGSSRGARNHQSATAIKSIKWAGVKFTYPFIGATGFFGLDSDSEDILDEQESESDEGETDDHENQNEDLPNLPVDGILSNESLQVNLATTERREKGHESNASEVSNLNKQEVNTWGSKPRRRSIDDPFSVTSSFSSSRIPNTSLTSKLTQLSASVSCESDLIRTRNISRTRTRLSSTHLKPSSSSSSSSKITTSNRVPRRSSRLINSHSYPDLLISQILEINRSNISSRSHRSFSSSSSSSDLS